MAGRTQLAIITVSRAALITFPAPTIAADVANGNFIINDGATQLVLLNSDSSPHTLSIGLASGIDTVQAGPRTYPVIVSGLRQIVGPFPIWAYGNQLAINLDSALVAVQAMSTFGP